MSQNLGQIIPNIQIGTVTQGQYPSVVNVGTGLNPVLNFTLQKGDPGSTEWSGVNNKPFSSIGNSLKVASEVIDVDVVDSVSDTQKPITSAAVYREIGSIEALLRSV